MSTVGHGGVLNMNIAPTSDGTMNASVIKVMADAGRAINETFHNNNVAKAEQVAGPCGVGLVVLDVSAHFDFVMTQEDLAFGQRM